MTRVAGSFNVITEVAVLLFGGMVAVVKLHVAPVIKPAQLNAGCRIPGAEDASVKLTVFESLVRAVMLCTSANKVRVGVPTAAAVTTKLTVLDCWNPPAAPVTMSGNVPAGVLTPVLTSIVP